MMTWQDAGQPTGSTSSGLFDGGFSWGLVLLGVVGLIALVIVCSARDSSPGCGTGPPNARQRDATATRDTRQAPPAG